MTGEEALVAFNKANELVKLGRYDEARAVQLLVSDRAVIERKIAEALLKDQK